MLIATPEKVLLDAVYLRRQVPFADELETDILDMQKLTGIAALYPARVMKALDRLRVQDCPSSM